MRSTGFAIFVVLATVAACGKMGPPDKPLGSTWPKGYPTGAIARPVPGLVNSGLDEQNQPVATVDAVKAHGSFTKSGAWIDPNMKRPTIDSTADQDKWHLNDPYGSGY